MKRSGLPMLTLLVLSLWSAPMSSHGESSRTVPTTSKQDIDIQYEQTQSGQTAEQVMQGVLERGLRDIANKRLGTYATQWRTYFSLLTPAEQTAEIARITSEITRLQAR